MAINISRESDTTKSRHVNPTYVDNKEVYINGYGKIRTYYYQFLYGSKNIMIQLDPDKLESSVKNNTILVGMGNLVN